MYICVEYDRQRGRERERKSVCEKIYVKIKIVGFMRVNRKKKVVYSWAVIWWCAVCRSESLSQFI